MAQRQPQQADKPRNPTPQIFPVRTFATPNQDVVFYVERDSRLPANKDFEYGEKFSAKAGPHQPDSRPYINYVLCHVTAADETGWQRWYYAADRKDQDDYNYEERDGQELIRTYIVPRGKPPRVKPGGTPDIAFDKYKFAGVSIKSPGQPLEGYFDVVVHRYIVSPTVDYQYIDALERVVKITKTVIEKGSFVTQPTTAGVLYEERDGGVYHDVEIKSECEIDPADFPVELQSRSGLANLNFPPRLDSVHLYWCEAYANSETHAPAYDDDYYFEFNLTNPRSGPFPTTVTRFLTSDPDTLFDEKVALLFEMPVPQKETVWATRWWAYTGTFGNKASALCKEYAVPLSVHTELDVGSNLPGDNQRPSTNWSRNIKPKLKKTVGFDGDFSGDKIIDIKVVQTQLNLSEVQVTTVHLGDVGVYAATTPATPAN